MGEKLLNLTIIITLFVMGLGTLEVNAHHRKVGKDHGHHLRAHGKANLHNNADSMKIVNELCAQTTYKDSCVKSLSSLAKKSGNNPQELFRNGLKLALDETIKAANIPNTLLPKATTKRENSAIESCKDLLEQSMDRLEMASNQVDGGGLVKTLKDPAAILNLRLELGDVNTFSTNCLDEFGEADAPQLQHLMQNGVNNAKELSVNLLDIVSTYTF